MSQSIFQETHFLLHSFLLGVIMVVIYDVIRIFRGVIKHGKISIIVEDFLYWIANSILIFIMLYKENNGSLRWFSIAGVALGMILYNVTISSFLVTYIVLALNYIIKFIGDIIKFIVKPFAFLLKKTGKAAGYGCGKGKLFMKFILKRLKNKWRTIKIVLCKR